MNTKQMRLITRDGVVAVPVDDARDRSVVSGHAQAVARFLATGEAEVLEPFVGVEVEGHQLLTDPDALEAWAAQGELDFPEIYEASR